VAAAKHGVFGRSASAPFTPTHVRKWALAAWERENSKREQEGQPLLMPVGLHELRHSYVSLMHDELGLRLTAASPAVSLRPSVSAAFPPRTGPGS
jgi:hypothetical protein